MIFEISSFYREENIRLKPRVGLYDTRDYMGRHMPGLTIVLDEVDQKENVTEQYAVLTVPFGELLPMKNCAYIAPIIAYSHHSRLPKKSHKIPAIVKPAASANIPCGCSMRTF